MRDTAHVKLTDSSSEGCGDLTGLMNEFGTFRYCFPTKIKGSPIGSLKGR